MVRQRQRNREGCTGGPHCEAGAGCGAAEPPATAAPSADGNQPLGFELKGIAYHPYLEQRGISTDLAVQYGVGYFPGKGSMAGRVVIPIRDESARLVAYAGRAIDDSEPKYKLPRGFQKSKVLFNRHAATADTVVVVEGFFDCLKVAGAGFPCVALMGCTMSDEQEALLESRNVILMLDGDEPGRAAQAELTTRLAATRFVRTVRLPDGKQPDMLTPAEIATVLTPLLR
jgi:DNA primase